MGMNEEHPPPPAASLDDLAVYALDAHEPDDTTAIESHLLAAPDAARWERSLRDAAGELAAAGATEISPPPDLRARVLAAALRARPAGRPVGSGPEPHGDAHSAAGAHTDSTAGASPVVIHRGEMRRVLELLGELGPDDWSRPLDPPEFAGWSVHDLAVHLVANESLLAHSLGVPVASIPETIDDNEARTAAARARHRDRPPGAAAAELSAAAGAVDDLVSALDEADLDAPITWWGGPTPIRIALLVRAFETWTHADDIRRALGIPMLATPPASLRTMTRVACAWLPVMLAASGAHHPDRVVRFHFADLPGASWDVDLGEIDHVRPADSAPADAEVTIDALAFCRGVANRVPPGGLTYVAQGDAELARAVVDALPVLAVL